MSKVLNKTLKQLDRSLNKLYDHPVVMAFLGIVFIAYGALAAPELPPAVASLFDSPVFKFLFMILILVLRNYSPVLALLASVAFIVSLQTFRRYESYAMVDDWYKSVKADSQGLGSRVVDDVVRGSEAVVAESEYLTGSLIGEGEGLVSGVLGTGGRLLSGVLGTGERLVGDVLGTGENLVSGVLGTGGRLAGDVLSTGEHLVGDVLGTGERLVGDVFGEAEYLAGSLVGETERLAGSLVGEAETLTGIRARSLSEHKDTEVSGVGSSGFMGAQGLMSPSGYSGGVDGAPYGGQYSEL